MVMVRTLLGGRETEERDLIELKTIVRFTDRMSASLAVLTGQRFTPHDWTPQDRKKKNKRQIGSIESK